MPARARAGPARRPYLRADDLPRADGQADARALGRALGGADAIAYNRACAATDYYPSDADADDVQDLLL